MSCHSNGLAPFPIYSFTLLQSDVSDAKFMEPSTAEQQHHFSLQPYRRVTPILHPSPMLGWNSLTHIAPFFLSVTAKYHCMLQIVTKWIMNNQPDAKEKRNPRANMENANSRLSDHYFGWMP